MTIDGKLIHPSDSVCNLRVIMHRYLSSGHRMNAIYNSENYHLRSFAHTRKYFSTRITRQLINALVLYRIDYCGSFFNDINSTVWNMYICNILKKIRALYDILLDGDK